MDTTDLWAVHVVGPDDIHACASMQLAFRNALWMNIGAWPLIANDDHKFGPTYIWATPELWDGTAEEHAEDLAEENAEDPKWSQPGTQVLANIALDVFGPGTPLDDAAAAQADGAS